MLLKLSSVLALVVAGAGAAVAAVLGPRRRALGEVVRRYFATPRGPFNLAIARIFFFLAVGVTLPERSVVAAYVHLPHELITPPGMLGSALPLTVAWVDVTHAALVAACVCGVLGLAPAARPRSRPRRPGARLVAGPPRGGSTGGLTPRASPRAPTRHAKVLTSRDRGYCAEP